MSRYMIETMDKINGLPRYHVTNPLEKNDLSHFKLSAELLSTYMDKVEDNQRELVLRGNNLQLRMGRRLKDSDMPYLTKFLHFNPDVTSLDLAYNELTNAGLYTITEFLQNHDAQLLKLNLMGNNIEWRSIAKLASMGENLSLHSLRVNGNKFGAEGGKALALLLACNPCLRHLDVGETDQDASSLAYFTTMLRWDHGGNTTLEMLDLSRPYGPWNYQFDVQHVAESMGQMLRYNCVLRELHLQKYGFSDHDIELMMLGLKDNRNLRLLDLSCNNIGCDGAAIIGNYLATRPALLGLMLGHNQIKDTGARSLSFTLPYSRVKLLDLSHNQLTDNGFLDILNSIKKPIILRCLYVWGNKITHKSLLTVRRMLLSGVLVQDHLDIKVYIVDQVMYVAYYHVDRYNHIYYCVNDYGFPPPRGLAQEHKSTIPTQLTTDHVASFKTGKKMPQAICPYGVMTRAYKGEGFGEGNKLLDE